VTQVKAGDAFNVIPQSAEMWGTIRTFEPDVRQRVLERFQQVVTGVASAMGCTATCDVRRLTPAVINEARLAEVVAQAARATLPDVTVDDSYRTTVSEDMAYLMEQVPGVYFMVGSANAERGLNYSHHHPRFDIDEAVMPRAAALMAATALELLS